MIIPVDREKDLLRIAAGSDLYPIERCIVRYAPEKDPKRIITVLVRDSSATVQTSDLTIQNTGPFDYSPEYRAMIRDLMIGF